MKLIRLFLSVVCFSMLMNACTPGDEVIGSKKNTEYVNTWIMNTLRDYYYWTDELPDKSNKTLSPDKYFKSILYWYDPVTAPNGDRFSWIEEDYEVLQGSLKGIVPMEIGFDMSIYYKDETELNLIGQVNYVKKGTPAERSGIKRGMWFDRLNGTILTTSNYIELINVTTADVSIGLVDPIYNAQGNLTGFSGPTEKTIQTVKNYSENPVYLDTVFTMESHKIGYFIYHFFAPDRGPDPGKKTGDFAYDLEMNAVFGRFKTSGITDLILDLRYNSGGSTSSAQLLASELVPSVSDTKLFAYYRYNFNLTAQYTAEEMKTYFTTKVMNQTVQIGTVNNVGNQLGGKVYILTGKYTASASEQIINGLKPYMNVVLIGDTTYGKNVASYTFYDEEHIDKNRWGMQPIIAKYFNSLGQSDFTAGFAPNYFIKDGGLNMKEFGDRNEPLLNKALNDILGTQTLPLVQMRAEKIQTERLLSLPGKRIRGMQLDNLPILK